MMKIPQGCQAIKAWRSIVRRIKKLKRILTIRRREVDESFQSLGDLRRY